MPIPRPSSRRRMGTAALLVAACALWLAMPAARAIATPDEGAPSTGVSDLTAATPAVPADAVPGEVLVRFEPGTAPDERRAARAAADADLDQVLRLPRAQVVSVDGPVDAAIDRLERRPDVAYAQPNYRYEALAEPAPDDTFFGSLWGLTDPATSSPGVGALEAWSTTRGAGAVIAILDTGVALDHPDLAPNLWDGPGDTHGWDFVDDDDDPDDYDYHGTHVAGTAAAVAGNGLGVAGVAPGAEIMAVRVLDGDGGGSTGDIADGIVWASQHGAEVINLSLGGSADPDDAMSDAVDVAAAEGAVVVAAAGNSGDDNDVDPTYPCALPQSNLVCVAAVSQSGLLAGFSNHGATTVDIAAPGTSILSARNDYEVLPVGGKTVEDFEAGLGGWSTFTAPGSDLWASTTASAQSGTTSATDSPGHYANASDSRLYTATPVDLSGERGCRVRAQLRYDVEGPSPSGELRDALVMGATSAPTAVNLFHQGGPPLDGLAFVGRSPQFDDPELDRYVLEEASISEFDARSDVHPMFALISNVTGTADGAYVDDTQLLCRDATYVDSLAPPGNYVHFQGTSMAAPHVAGVAALVRSAVPGTSPQQVIAAIEGGGAPLPLTSGKSTTTGGTADAAGALALALGLPYGGGGGGGGDDGGAGSPGPGPSPPATDPAPSGAPSALPGGGSPVSETLARPRLPGVRRVRVRRRGFVRVVRAEPGLRAAVRVTTSRRPIVRRRPLRRGRHLLLERRTLTVPSSGRARIRIRLSRRELRVLRRSRRLHLRMIVTIRDDSGGVARRDRAFVLLRSRR